MATLVPEEAATMVPPSVNSVEDTGLDAGFISDLLLKHLYFGGVVAGATLAAAMCLPYYQVIEGILESLKTQSFVEVRGSTGVLSTTYRYSLTEKGHHRVKE